MEIKNPDIKTIKQMMKATWEDGDYGELSRYKKNWDEDFISRLPISAELVVLATSAYWQQNVKLT